MTTPLKQQALYAGGRDSNDIDSTQQRTHNLSLVQYNSLKCVRSVFSFTYKHGDIFIWHVSTFFSSKNGHEAERKVYGQTRASVPPASCQRLPDCRKADLHKQPWVISSDCCLLRSCKSNSPATSKQPHNIHNLFTSQSTYDIKKGSVPNCMQALYFCKKVAHLC